MTETIKSNDRVKNHGEVFTPLKTVKFMLDQPEIQEKINDLSATFLEPAAGEGAFLVELLRRKMHVAKEISHSFDEYNQNALIALSSLYGIELLKDNFEILIKKMYKCFKKNYCKVMREFCKKANEKVLKSAMVIIKANIVQGDTLKQITSNGKPIIFSEWQLLSKENGIQKVQRIEHTLKDILDDHEQLSLFNDSFMVNLEVYLPVNFIDVYKEQKM